MMDEMIQEMINIVRANDLCVLATVSGGEPHCSLMSYVADAVGREIYLVSRAGTKKYANVMENRLVSLLIDTREAVKGEKRTAIKALTVSGEFQAITDAAKKEHVRARFAETHPHLSDFLSESGVEIFSIKIKSFQLLDGVTDASFAIVD